jgi:hypothetical protein
MIILIELTEENKNEMFLFYNNDYLIPCFDNHNFYIQKLKQFLSTYTHYDKIILNLNKKYIKIIKKEFGDDYIILSAE